MEILSFYCSPNCYSATKTVRGGSMQLQFYIPSSFPPPTSFRSEDINFQSRAGDECGGHF